MTAKLIIFRMNPVNLLLSLLFLINTKTITATSVIEAPTPVPHIDSCREQVNQILVQMCASEIDRNKTTSAIAKLGQLSNAEDSLKDVVQFFTEHYEDNFNNLLHFIDHILSNELQQVAYNAITDSFDNGLHFINVFRLDNFVRVKLELTDLNDGKKRLYEKLLNTISSQLKKFVDETDLSVVVNYTKSSNDPERVYDLILNLVHGVDLNNFTVMNKVFDFSMQLPFSNQLKFIAKILSEMQTKSQYRHVFHVIIQIKQIKQQIRHLIPSRDTLCLLAKVENQVPTKFRYFVEHENYSSIKNLATNEFIFYSESQNDTKDTILVPTVWSWSIDEAPEATNSLLICEVPWFCLGMVQPDSNKTITIPIAGRPDRYERSPYFWYLLISDDLGSIQIINTLTGKCLIAGDDDQELKGNALRNRVVLSKCLDDPSHKWIFNSTMSLNELDVYRTEVAIQMYCTELLASI